VIEDERKVRVGLAIALLEPCLLCLSRDTFSYCVMVKPPRYFSLCRDCFELENVEEMITEELGLQ